MKGKIFSAILVATLGSGAMLFAGCNGASPDLKTTAESLQKTIAYVQTESSFTSRDLAIGSVKFTAKTLPEYSESIYSHSLQSANTEFYELSQLYDSMFMFAFDYIVKYDDLLSLENLEGIVSAQNLLADVDRELAEFNSTLEAYEKSHLQFVNFMQEVDLSTTIAKSALLKYKKDYKNLIGQTIDLALSISVYQEAALSEEVSPYIEISGEATNSRSVYDNLCLQIIDQNYRFLIESVNGKTPVVIDESNSMLDTLVAINQNAFNNYVAFAQQIGNANVASKLNSEGLKALNVSAQTFTEECQNFEKSLSSLNWHKLIFRDKGDVAQFEGNYLQISNLFQVENFMTVALPTWTNYLSSLFS